MSSGLFLSGQIAMTGAAQQLVTLPKSTASVVLKNRVGSTGNIYLGVDNGVSATNGYELSPGENVSMDVINGGKIWVIGTAADRLSWATVGA